MALSVSRTSRSLGALAAALCIVLMTGCSTGMVSQNGDLPLAEVPKKEGSETTLQALVREGLAQLDQRDYEKASRLFNAALKLDVTNADLHFLNALTYHLMGVDGDSTKYELAEQGLTRALKFDPSHYSARYQLGLLYMDERRYRLAEVMFASAALNHWDNPDVIYNLAAAAYYARDPRTAEAALMRLGEITPDLASRPLVLRATAISAAAVNDNHAAEARLAAYRASVGNSASAAEAARRVASWNAFYREDAPILLAQSTADVGSGNQSYSDYWGGAGSGGSPQYDSDSVHRPQDHTYGTQDQLPNSLGAPVRDNNDMVVVDVVLIGTQEDERHSRGVNLLNGLQLQFGDPLTGTAGLSMNVARSQFEDKKDSANDSDTVTKTFTKSLNIAAVNYSLNIANALNANDKILAKPSLVAQNGQTSEFFSGTEILAAAVSGGQGDSVSVQKEVGVKLAVTPETLPDGLVRLHVLAERTFLTDPSSSVVFQFRLDTTKTNVNATVTMPFGETLLIGGLSEREMSNSLDGVPILRRIPVVNMLFSERVRRDFRRSILILLTPRRPQYATRSSEHRDEDVSGLSLFEKDLERLENRHKDLFRVRPTFNEILEKLQGREFFNEFQMGDMQIKPWQGSIGNKEHIAQVRRRISADQTATLTNPGKS